VRGRSSIEGRRRASDGGTHPAGGAYGHDTRRDRRARRVQAHDCSHVADHIDEDAGRDETASPS
jgi:hypothetical protein